MKKKMEENLQNNLVKFFKETNNYNFEGIQDLFEYLSIKMKNDGFKHQQISFSLRNTMIVFQELKYINNTTINTTINIIVNEENLKILAVNKTEHRLYNEIIF